MQVSNRMSYNIVLVDFRSTATLLKWSVMMQEIQAVRRWDRLDTNPQISQTNSEATQTRWTIKNHTSGISAEIVCLGSEGFFFALCVCTLSCFVTCFPFYASALVTALPRGNRVYRIFHPYIHSSLSLILVWAQYRKIALREFLINK